MDWKDLSEQLALGEKQWKVFRDGAAAATMMWNLERAKDALQAQYDALPGQIDQAKADLQAVKDRTAKALADGAKAAASQAEDVVNAQSKRVADAQKELEVWGSKILAQSQSFDAEYAHYQDVIKGLKSQIDQLTGQIDTLEQIKSNLKSQLQGVA